MDAHPKLMAEVGDRVVAVIRITEHFGEVGDELCERDIVDPEDGTKHINPRFVHANPGDEGVVESVSSDELGDPYMATVRFDRTGTSCPVFSEEIKKVRP